MRPTLYSIAQKAGVSISTVSRVLNMDTKKPASRATTERVLKIANELGYNNFILSPNQTAISSPSTKLVTCILASPADSYSDYFFSQIMIGAQTAANEHGFSIVNAFSTSTHKLEEFYDHIMFHHYDGILLLGRIKYDMINYLLSKTSNLVYAGLNRLNIGIDEVICDAYAAVKSAITYLVENGYHKIGFIGTIPEKNSNIINEHRFDAYCSALAAHNINLNMNYCKNIDLVSPQGYSAAKELILSGNVPEAIFCAGDSVAIGVISALEEAGIQVPEQVGVVGLDDDLIASYTRPSLTTINMQKSELGRFAMQLLVDRINGKHTIPVLIELPFQLVERDSCRKKQLRKE